MDKYISDITGIAGLATFGTGAWMYDPKIALVSIGVLLMFAAYRMARGK